MSSCGATTTMRSSTCTMCRALERLRHRPRACFLSQVEGLLMEPSFVPIPTCILDDNFAPTAMRPSWTHCDTPPSIVDTLWEWHLTKSQAEFAVMVLHHFHTAKDGKDPDQFLALCLGVPGMGKSQTMLAILWHMSQHRPRDALQHEVTTCVYTEGASMLIGTLATKSMTTCRQFQTSPTLPSRSPSSSASASRGASPSAA